MKNDQNTAGSSNAEDPTKSKDGKPPADPSNTSHIGQPIEQVVIKKDEGLNEQSNEGEDLQERTIPGEGDNSFEERMENYIKNPSPEDKSEV